MQLISQSKTLKENLESAVEHCGKERPKKIFFCALENLESFFHK